MRKLYKGMQIPKLGTPKEGNSLLVFENDIGMPSGWVMSVLPSNLKTTDNWQQDAETLTKYLEMHWYNRPYTIVYSPSGVNKGW